MSVLDRFRLDDELVLLTGGAGLLGRGYVQALLASGAQVVAVDINQDQLVLLAGEHSQYADKLLCLCVDITRETALIEASQHIFTVFKRYPTVLINNAAIDPKVTMTDGKNLSRLENFDLDQWNFELNVGLTGAMLCAKVFAPKMAVNGRGVIVNVASDLGIIAPDQRLYQQPGVAPDMQSVKPVTYSVIKHGLIGLTKYLATYWIGSGIRCNAFAPGGVQYQQPDDFVHRVSALIPMGRMAELGEYEATIVYLCSSASSYLNGAVLVMDGGRCTW